MGGSEDFTWQIHYGSLILGHIIVLMSRLRSFPKEVRAKHNISNNIGGLCFSWLESIGGQKIRLKIRNQNSELPCQV